MLSHVVVGASNLELSRAFYDATFAALDLAAGILDGDRRYLYISPTGLFVVGKPVDDGPGACGNGLAVGFHAKSPEQVDAWHAAGIRNAGTTCEDPPGPRKTDFGELYAAYLRDPDGNKLCAIFGMSG